MGSIIAILQAIADQGHLLFGDHGIVQTIEDAYHHADTISGFGTHFDQLAQYFLGTTSGTDRPTKKEADQIIKIFEPVAKESASQLAIQFTGTVNIATLNVTINSQQANTVQNAAKRYLVPAIPANSTQTDEILVLHQVRGDPKSKVGDKGTIESISPLLVKLLFCSDDIKKAILDLPENPFQQAFLVDVDVRTVEQKPAPGMFTQW